MKTLRLYSFLHTHTKGEKIVNKMTLEVNGMACESCVQKVENGLSEINGIDRVLADIEKGQVFVEYDPQQVQLRSMEEKIQLLGYSLGETVMTNT
jgi:copper ion binding protein